MAELVLRETGLLPHLNPGVLTPDDYRSLRAVAPSMGIMLESASDAARGARRPAFRLAGQEAGGAPEGHRGCGRVPACR